MEDFEEKIKELPSSLRWELRDRQKDLVRGLITQKLFDFEVEACLKYATQ